MYFFIYIFSAVLVYGNPICRKHIKSVVHCAISLPLRRNDKRLNNVYIAVKFGEELPGVNIPVSVKPRSAQILRQRFKLVDVIRLRFHQRVVVLRLCRNKSVILRVLVRVKKPVNKQSLYPVVTGASRVRRKIGSFRKIIYASNNGFQSVELIFGKLRRFVYKQNIVFLPLVLQNITVRCTISCNDNTLFSLVFVEIECLVSLFVFGNSVQLLFKRRYVVSLKLRKGSPNYKHLYPRIVNA